MIKAFFGDFLKMSHILTVTFVAALILLFLALKLMQKRKIGFSARVLTATGMGLVLGLVIQLVAGFPDAPTEVTWIAETTKWYSLFGNGFIDLIRMLVIPLIMVSIIHVIINMKEGADIGRLARVTIIVTLVMVAVSAVLGLILGNLFGLGLSMGGGEATAEIKEVQSIVDTLRALLPANPVSAMVNSNIIALVIFSAFFGIAAKRMSHKYMHIVGPFYDLINALQKIIISVAMTIIKLMPYAVIALLASTIAQRGLKSILEVLQFIGVLYLAVVIMFIIQLLALLIFGINPRYYLRKGFAAMVMAFTSRSSVGTLPLTVASLTNKMGVNEGTANFVAGFGTTAGMQGCAGIFPALLIVFVANMGGVPIDLTLMVMSVIVVTVGSLGIAGIPGTATMAASVSLSGTGMAASFPLISPILAVDPLIDMGRTLLNVTGAMTNALIVDKILGHFDEKTYKDMSLNNTVDGDTPLD